MDHPTFGEDVIVRAVELHRAGRVAEAESLYRAVLERNPEHPDANHNLGIVAVQSGNPHEALPFLKAALEAVPSQRQFWLSYIDALAASGAIGDARRALTDGEAAGLDGPETIALRQRLNELEEATALFEAAFTAHKSGAYGEAADLYRKLLDVRPNSPEILTNFGAVLFSLGRLKESEAAYRRAIRLDPKLAQIHNNLGNALREQGRFEEAEASYRAAIAIKPHYPEAHNNLGIVLRDQDRLDDATASCSLALEIDPSFESARINLANLLRETGDADGAFHMLEESIIRDPENIDAHRSLLLTLAYHPSIDPEKSLALHRRFGTLTTRGAAGHDFAHRNRPEPGRRLRIAYMSGDFRTHSVARSLLPLLKAHDRDRVEVYCIEDVIRPDSVTAEFRSIAENWLSTSGDTDAHAAKKICDREIDILVSVAGRFDRNRPQICAYRPAPIQVSLYDAATSGLDSVDYIFADRHLVPKGGVEQFTERVLRLGGLFLTQIPSKLPAIKPRTGPFSFASLNNPAKVSLPTLRLWARLLGAVPDSRLVLRYGDWYRSRAIRTRIEANLESLGVDASRISYPSAASSYFEHLEGYNGIDVALDTFPFSGSSTTIDALIMGVPVVALRGNTMMSRWTASILERIGLTELVARSPEEYVVIARGLANAPDRLSELRLGLRRKVEDSPICDAARTARQMERYYRAIWRRWCDRVNRSLSP